jgi:hypothetical protein
MFLTGMSIANLPMVHGPGWYDDVSAISGWNGFIARFDGTDRHAEWISYLGGGTAHYPMAIGLDLSGGMVVVGGYTNDTEFSPLEFSGYYYQPAYNSNAGQDEDAFMVGFKTSTQSRLWSTLFGGEAGHGWAIAERITASCPSMARSTPPDGPRNIPIRPPISRWMTISRAVPGSIRSTTTTG